MRSLGEPILAVRDTSRLRNGLGFSTPSDEDVRFMEIVGGGGEMLASEGRAFDKKPAWNLLGFATRRLDVSAAGGDGLDSSTVLSLFKYNGIGRTSGIDFSGELRSGEDSNF